MILYCMTRTCSEFWMRSKGGSLAYLNNGGYSVINDRIDRASICALPSNLSIIGAIRTPCMHCSHLTNNSVQIIYTQVKRYIIFADFAALFFHLQTELMHDVSIFRTYNNILCREWEIEFQIRFNRKHVPQSQCFV